MRPNLVRAGDRAIGTGTHGRDCCKGKHQLTGVWTHGSVNVISNGRHTIRRGDIGTHNCPHCGVMIAVGIQTDVSINGIYRHYRGGSVNFNCGTGITVDGSDNLE